MPRKQIEPFRLKCEDTQAKPKQPIVRLKPSYYQMLEQLKRETGLRCPSAGSSSSALIMPSKTWRKESEPMSEKEKQLALDILGIFERLPEPQQHRLVGVAEGLDMASAATAHDAAVQEQERDGAATHEHH